jgi:uncharacterized protein (TIGR00251 family)
MQVFGLIIDRCPGKDGVFLLLVMKVKVIVKPNARRQEVTKMPDDSLLVYLRSPPVDGKANAELIEVLAKFYGVRRSRIAILQGTTARHKLVEIDN